jgi:hypothetical protein
MLDNHLTYLGLAVQVTSKGTKSRPAETKLFESINGAMTELNLKGKPKGAILRSLLGKTDYVYGYNWKLIKINL